MKRLIVIESNTNQVVSLNKLINQIGRYLYNHIDGALSYKTSTNHATVEMMILYQRKLEDRTGNQDEDDMHEMHLELDLTTYSDKIRLNIIRLDESEKTLGSYTIRVDQPIDYTEVQNQVMSKVRKSLIKEYNMFEFIF